MMADATRTRRVLLNLVTNACKHLASKVCRASQSSDSNVSSVNDSNDGQGQILIRVRRVHAEDNRAACTIDLQYDNAKHQWLRFEVHDNGDGVPNDLRSQLFVGAFVTAPWSGKCDTPPTTDPRGGDPEPVPEVERICDDTSTIPEMISCARAPYSSSAAESLRNRTGGLPVIPGVSDDSAQSVDQYLNDFAKHQGSGLGLFVANLCVQEMGGNIGFRCARDLKPNVSRSTRGATAPLPLLGGSVFWFDIPFVPVDKLQKKSMQFGSLDSLCDLLGHCDDSNSTRSWCRGFHSEDDLLGLYRTQEKGSPQPNTIPTFKESIGDGLNVCLRLDNDSSSESAACDDKPAANETITGPQTQLERSRVLVVDDSTMVQKLLCRSLASLNFDTDTACNGREALAKMKETCYRAVLMDFLMPVMDGIAATAEYRAWERDSRVNATSLPHDENASAGPVRNDFRHQLVIGISANVSDSELDTAWEAGIDHFIRKPVKV